MRPCGFVVSPVISHLAPLDFLTLPHCSEERRRSRLLRNHLLWDGPAFWNQTKDEFQLHLSQGPYLPRGTKSRASPAARYKDLKGQHAEVSSKPSTATQETAGFCYRFPLFFFLLVLGGSLLHTYTTELYLSLSRSQAFNSFPGSPSYYMIQALNLPLHSSHPLRPLPGQRGHGTLQCLISFLRSYVHWCINAYVCMNFMCMNGVSKDQKAARYPLSYRLLWTTMGSGTQTLALCESSLCSNHWVYPQPLSYNPTPASEVLGLQVCTHNRLKSSLECPGGGAAQGLTGWRRSVPPSPKTHVLVFVGFFFFFLETFF